MLKRRFFNIARVKQAHIFIPLRMLSKSQEIIKNNANTAIFCNVRYKNSYFHNLKIEKGIDKRIIDLSEGYDFQLTEIRHPLIGEDPTNAYSSVQYGWGEPTMTLFAKYDANVRYLHRKDITDKYYNNAMISNKNEMKYVTMENSAIIQTDFCDIKMEKMTYKKCVFFGTTLTNMVIEDVEFSDVTFDNVKMDNVVFSNCTFIGKIIFESSNLRNVNCTKCFGEKDITYIDTNRENMIIS